MTHEKTHLNSFCNIQSEYCPEERRLSAKKVDTMHNVVWERDILMCQEEFHELYDRIGREFDMETAVEWNANAAERLLTEAGMFEEEAA